MLIKIATTFRVCSLEHQERSLSPLTGERGFQQAEVKFGDAGRVCINLFIREFEEDLSDVE